MMSTQSSKSSYCTAQIAGSTCELTKLSLGKLRSCISLKRPGSFFAKGEIMRLAKDEKGPAILSNSLLILDETMELFS